MRPAEPDRHPEALAVADGDVGTPRTGRLEQREREQVGGRDDQRPGGLRLGGERREVAHPAVGGGILHEAADGLGVEGELVGVGHHGLDAARLGAGADHLDGLRMAAGVDQEDRMIPPVLRVQRHRHRLGRRGPLVEERRGRDREPGEVGGRGLEGEERLEPALGDLRLVRGVGGVPARILEDVALDHLGHEGAVVPHPDERGEDAVLLPHAAEGAERLALGARRGDVERAAEPDRLGHDGVDEVIERLVAEDAEHLLDLVLAGPEVPGGERVGEGVGPAEGVRAGGGNGSGCGDLGGHGVARSLSD